MKNPKNKRKKKNSRSLNPITNGSKVVTKDDGNGHVDGAGAITEALSMTSLNDSASASREARLDLNESSRGLYTSSSDNTDDITTTSSSSVISVSCSSSSSNSLEDVLDYKGCRGNKQKRVIAATGTISTVLGKDYVRSSMKRDSRNKFMNVDYGNVSKPEAEQFLCSMLGNDCELSMAVVRDVLCQCGYDVEKALNVLLDLSASSSEQSKQDLGYSVEQQENLIDRASDSTSYSSESEFQESIWSLGAAYRNDARIASHEGQSQTPQTSRNIDSDLPQTLLETLFNISKSPEYEPSTMNWSSIVKKMKSLGPGIDVYTSSGVQNTCDIKTEGDAYQLHRNSANQLWDTTKSYYQRAAAAHAKGERQYATYLSEQGRVQTRLAQKADEKASHNIFKARNKDIENVITIDLHGQHVKQAMRLLKMHLLFGSYVPSIQSLRVITGCGSHGLGKSKLKISVVKLLETEGIGWSEENQGTLLIKLNGQREFNFLESNSDTE